MAVFLGSKRLKLPLPSQKFFIDVAKRVRQTVHSSGQFVCSFHDIYYFAIEYAHKALSSFHATSYLTKSTNQAKTIVALTRMSCVIPDPEHQAEDSRVTSQGLSPLI